ncbi:hypothetical protein D3C72_1741170 [compost metagenome]
MFEVVSGNLEQGSEHFAAHLALCGRRTAVTAAGSRSSKRWSGLGLLLLGLISWVLVK